MKKKVLVSVSDKNGIVDFCKKLVELNFEVISTGGTAKTLQKSGIPVIEIDAYTGFPEMLDGRVKTLHPKIHAGILAMREKRDHLDVLANHGIPLIDMVVVNLYPFKETIKNPEVILENAIEQIDIGGPTMIRAAAKNYKDVSVVTDPSDYDNIINILKENGEIPIEFKYKLAAKVFKHTADYDGAIAQFLSQRDYKNNITQWPETISYQFSLQQQLRYGENPHQNAAFYAENNASQFSLAHAKQYQGKELSFNNIVDTEAAYRLIAEFKEKPTLAFIKHTNPCGIATGETISDAFYKAKEVDPVSAFGGIVASNKEIDLQTAEGIKEMFLEVVIAPKYTQEALELLSSKKNLRVLEMPLPEQHTDYDIKRVEGGVLLQEWDEDLFDNEKLKTVSKREPTEDEKEALYLAWKIVKHVKSNAVVFANKDRALGIGAGQMSRVDSVKIAVEKSNFDLKGAVLASDAFFPFRDNIDEAHKVGIIAVIQPGGSIRDQEVIDAVDEYDMSMIFTGMRHFKH